MAILLFKLLKNNQIVFSTENKSKKRFAVSTIDVKVGRLGIATTSTEF